MTLISGTALSVAKQLRISARDRRGAAIHEAGHVTIGRHIGLVGLSARIERNLDGDKFNKLWIGRTRYLPPSAIGRNLPQKKQALVAVAGSVAEFCWEGVNFADTLTDYVWEDPNTMSDTDWAGCGCDPGNPTRQALRAIETVFSLLDRQVGPLWPPLLSEARSLIKEAR